MRPKIILSCLAAVLALQLHQRTGHCDEPWSVILPEQRHMQVRAPEQVFPVAMAASAPPATVADPDWDATAIPMSLSDVLNASLQNMEVVRILSGVTAVSSGQTIYDPAITNTNIDTARAQFDPALNIDHNWAQSNQPIAIADPGDPTRSLIARSAADRYNWDLNLSKRMVTGGVIDFGVIGSQTRLPFGGAPLNPQNASAPAIQLTQPFLQGAGRLVNQAPVVIARLDAERSYFQFKDSVQSHVQSIIQGYWQLVQARTELWARQQQVQQLEFALKRAEARVEVGDASLGDLSQARVAYENFRANLLVAQGNILARESALRNVLGLPPYSNERIIPTSPLVDQKMEVNWDELLQMAEQRRPDIIELKMILEADQQRLLIRNNQALPQLNGVALYRWNGLSGTMPNGNSLNSGSGFDDWALGVNFTVPLGLRSARASLRQQELLIDRDHANIRQGLHQAQHSLAINLRNLDLFYAQYKRFQEVRQAAQINLDQQIAIGNTLVQFIVLLQAVTDWGNAVSNEAQALVQYNSELAALEKETGTILETHGITFVEERFGSLSPLGRHALPACYPKAIRPTDGDQRYADSGQPSEQQFNLRSPVETTLPDEKPAEDSSIDSAEQSSRQTRLQPTVTSRFVSAPSRLLQSIKQAFK